MRNLTLGALSALTLAACSKPTEPPNVPDTTSPALTSGVDKSNFDDTVRAQDDFYRHVNGAWLKEHPVPAEKSNYGSFSKLADDAEAQLKDIIEESAAMADKQTGSAAQQVGDYYESFMDKAKADGMGFDPLAEEFEWIDSLKDHGDLAALYAHLSRIGVNVLPGYINTDKKKSDQYILYLAQGGTGLPDRDYYLLDDEKFAAIRAKYEAHIAAMLSLASINNAKDKARDILALETRFADKQWTKVQSRDADKTYNKYALEDVPQLAPSFNWKTYFADVGATKSPGVIISQPGFFEAWDGILTETDLDTLKAYLKWNVLSGFAPYLSAEFVQEDFDFYGTTLNGITELKPRWKRGVDAMEGAMGEVLGRIYVERHFPPEAKARMSMLVTNLINAYEASIKDLEWMSDETKQKALGKLAQFTPKIAYPDKWRDYSGLEVKEGDLVGNVMRANEFAHEYEVAKLGAPVDRDEWHMTPQTVNAYYNPGMNEIVFPAAILQPPFFDMHADDAVNYGGIGAVIGHEIGHGFDDQGSKYDGTGNLISWWTDEDRRHFEARTKALIDQYNAFEALPGEHVNGALTIGENIGDLGGLSIAYEAYHLSLGDKEPPVIDGLTGDQRLFMGWAQVWRRNYKDENLLSRVKADPHSPSEFRCNGVLRNIDAWYTAFDVKQGDAMYLPPDERVHIW